MSIEYRHINNGIKFPKRALAYLRSRQNKGLGKVVEELFGSVMKMGNGEPALRSMYGEAGQ